MIYLKYLWTTNLQKLSNRDKSVAIFIYKVVPLSIFAFLSLWTAFKIDLWQLWLVVGFLLGNYFREVMTVFNYAFEKELHKGVKK